ncbi:MAG: 3-phosphoshikimate 1-carboxyvinyltransferase [Actinobacteria bacterium]|uniref:3-phosphoshikimate 1-carboxyvinyltransferase n=1 Tax=freshwater metagenome TaxID=449393 RepID=A0A6J7D3B0_9ZZZZ|nr:3-phosphoshikimate 1-carboxyvinyltransferase [Actinomycetota bacterium]
MSGQRFEPAQGPLSGRIETAADKSISHRAAIFAALATGTSTIDNYLLGEDTLSTLRVLAQLGVPVQREGSRVVIEGLGLRGPIESDAILDVGNSGTLLRLVSGWLAGQDGGSWVLDGDQSIRSRPMARVSDPLEEMGASFELQAGGTPPLTVRGASLEAISYESPVASAQVKSAVLIAGLLASGPVSVSERPASRDHTERMLAEQGAALTVTNDGDRRTVTVQPSDGLRAVDRLIPGDPSSAAFPLVAALLVPGSEVTVDNINLNPARTGLFRILERMGAQITGLNSDSGEGDSLAAEVPGAITVKASALRGVEVEASEIPAAVDEITLVALAACFATGQTIVRGAGELRVKETDRIAGVVELLSALGGAIEATDDGFVVDGSGGLRGGTVDSHGDHRLAMLAAVAGVASETGVTVTNFEAADVSYPDFASDLASLA